MLVNPDFCSLVEEIGKASLVATDAEIWTLTKVYWYTVEFGVVKEGDAIKAFGAGILSRSASHIQRLWLPVSLSCDLMMYIQSQ
jgi:phenylalanine-4-hydroxylase